MVNEALDTGKMKVYSSYPIENGTWVTPSRMEAESYAGNGKAYSKEINLNDVAWVDPTQGMYANTKIKRSNGHKPYADSITPSTDNISNNKVSVN